MPPSSSSPAFPPLLSPDANPSDKTWEARAVFAAVPTAVTSEDDEDGEIDVGKVRVRIRKRDDVCQVSTGWSFRLCSTF